MREDGIDSLVEHKDGQAVKVRGRGDDHVATGEGLFTRQAPIRAEQLAGELLEIDLRRLIAGTRHLDRGDEIGRGMTAAVSSSCHRVNRSSTRTSACGPGWPGLRPTAPHTRHRVRRRR